VINLQLVDARARFEASLGATEKANLKLSSRRLSVATVGGVLSRKVDCPTGRARAPSWWGVC
jgi:hypothetical protein